MTDQQNDNPVKKPRKKYKPRTKGSRSFWIPRSGADSIIKLSAVDIFTYFIICNHRDKKHSKLSRVGVSGISTQLGISRANVENSIRMLIDHKLIQSAEQCRLNIASYNKENRRKHYGKDYQHEYIPRKSPGIPEFKWSINQFGEKSGYGVWFSSDIISNDKSARFPTPLKNIIRIQNKDAIARLLLLIHREYDLSLGISPAICTCLYETELLALQKHYVAYRVRYMKTEISCYSLQKLFNEEIYLFSSKKPLSNEQKILQYKDALKYLESNGFIVKVVAAYSKSIEDDITAHLYTLDVKDPHRVCQSEKHETVAQDVDEILKSLGINLERNDTRHYNLYNVITQTQTDPEVRGDYKPTYLPSNPNNTPLENALNQKIKNHRIFKMWLKSLLDPDIDKKPQFCNENFNDIDNAVISKS